MFGQKIKKMKLQRTKSEGKSVTITAERLSDNSRITFTLSSDKTIEQLRTLLNHHLPPHIPNQFFLYSYQRGALIHFHPPSFNLDYFPVIFDQPVLQLKMDDRRVDSFGSHNPKYLSKEIKNSRCSFLNRLVLYPSYDVPHAKPSPSKITCLTVLKRMFHPSFRSNNVNTDNYADVLTY